MIDVAEDSGDGRSKGERCGIRMRSAVIRYGQLRYREEGETTDEG